MPVDKSADRVRQMFGEIARRYDLLNRLLSLGIDRSWRRRTIRLAPPSGEGPILDLCTGTADLALAYWRAVRGTAPVVGADFCHPMLVIAREKVRRSGAGGSVSLVEADAQQLPFPDGTFQIVSVAFGLRNIADTDRGLREMVRVCRSGGRVAVLEFLHATNLALPHILRVVLPPRAAPRRPGIGREPAERLQLPSGERRRVSAGRIARPPHARGRSPRGSLSPFHVRNCHTLHRFQMKRRGLK